MTERSSWNLAEFAERHGFSEGFVRRLCARGLGPVTIDMGFGPRITVEAERQWLAELADPTSPVAKAMAARAAARSERARAIGTKRVASPRHICRPTGSHSGRP